MNRTDQNTPDSLVLEDGAPQITIGRDISLEILSSKGFYQGLGQILVGGKPLRSTERPILPEIRSPDAIHFNAFDLKSALQIPGGGFRLHLGLFFVEGGPMEWMLHTIRPRYRRTDWTQSARKADDSFLTLEILPVERQIGKDVVRGFSYRYAYQSKTVPIYRILDRATWEPGGGAIGNEFWMRNAFSPPVYRFENKESAFSTEWYLPSATNPNVFEFLPFQTQLCGFTMTAHATGTLLTWVPKTSHVRSLFEKPAGRNQIVHLHELCGDLALDFSPPPIEILWVPGERDRVGRINLYEAMRSMVSEALHAQVGMRVERASSYGSIEEWDNADLQKYAEKGLPKLAAAGVETVFLTNQFENNMNAFGVSNMCCTTDLRVAESVGEENLANFCRKASEQGMQVEMWGNTSLSTMGWMAHMRNGREDRLRFNGTHATVFDQLGKSEDPWVRNPSNAIEADHYTPVFMAMNLRDETVRKIWLDRWRDAAERLGLRGIFLDSSFNLSSDKFHWIARQKANGHGATSDQRHLLGFSRPQQEPPSAILSQYIAHLTLMAEMQKMGYVYCGEDMGVFGVHRAGAPSGFVAAALPVWVDCLPDFDPMEMKTLGYNPDDIFFRGIAYRVIWKLQWDPKLDRLTWIIGKSEDPNYTPKPEQLRALQVYSLARPFMSRREVLPGEKGVVYRGGGKTVLWTFEPLQVSFSLGQAKIRELFTEQLFEAKDFSAAKVSVYLIDADTEITCS